MVEVLITSPESQFKVQSSSSMGYHRVPQGWAGVAVRTQSACLYLSDLVQRKWGMEFRHSQNMWECKCTIFYFTIKHELPPLKKMPKADLINLSNYPPFPLTLALLLLSQ